MKWSFEKWVFVLAFQALYGVAVFALTRAYYEDHTVPIVAERPTAPSAAPQIGAMPRFGGADPALLQSDDIGALRTAADGLFQQRQYAEAERYYVRLLELAPDDGENYNNLGLTRHYLGRSAEAAQTLRRGTEVDPGYQRVWLTLGFVQASSGETEAARSAFETAVRIDQGTPIAEEAKKMMARLQ